MGQQQATIYYKHRYIESMRRYHLEDAKLYAKRLSQRRKPTAWKNAKMMIIMGQICDLIVGLVVKAPKLA